LTFINLELQISPLELKFSRSPNVYLMHAEVVGRLRWRMQSVHLHRRRTLFLLNRLQRGVRDEYTVYRQSVCVRVRTERESKRGWNYGAVLCGTSEFILPAHTSAAPLIECHSGPYFLLLCRIWAHDCAARAPLQRHSLILISIPASPPISPLER
jgi:hypothetical protein